MLAGLPQLVRLVKILRMFEKKEIIEVGIDFENFGDDNLEFSKIILRDILYPVYKYCYEYLYIRTGIFLDFYYYFDLWRT